MCRGNATCGLVVLSLMVLLVLVLVLRSVQDHRLEVTLCKKHKTSQ